MKLLFHGKAEASLYPFYLACPPSPSPSLQALSCQHVPLDIWHFCLGHASYKIVEHLASINLLPVSLNKQPLVCNSCQKGKSHRLPFQFSHIVSNGPLDLILSAVWGPSPIMSENGNKYYVSFVYHFSKFTWIFPLPTKSSVLSIFISFQKHVERLLNRKIKCVQTDWGVSFDL